MEAARLPFRTRSESPADISALLEDARRRLSALEEMESDVHRRVEKLHEWVQTQQALACLGHGRNWRSWLKQTLGFHLGVLLQYRSRPLSLPARYPGTPCPDPAPVISVVTPSFNQGQFLERTLCSVLDQGYPRLEYVVQDGGSADDSAEVLARHADRLSRWESRPDGGQAEAINLAFAHTTGEVMAYLNSDDVLLPGSLAFVARYFAEHPEVDVVYGHRVIIDQWDGEIGRWVMPPHQDDVLSWCDFVPQETLFWRRHIWDRAGGRIDESFRFALDWDLILRFRDAGARFVRLPRFLGAMRFHAQQKTLSQLLTVGEKEMNRVRKRVHGRYVTHREIRRGTFWYLVRHALCHRLYTLGLLEA
jgi:glycosyltransferase involved in cell wall biosynthesis